MVKWTIHLYDLTIKIDIGLIQSHFTVLIDKWFTSYKGLQQSNKLSLARLASYLYKQ